MGWSAAFAEALGEREQKAARLAQMRDEIQAGLLKIPEAVVNGANAARLPGTLNMSFSGVDGQSLIFALDSNGIAASSGSACASGSISPSHVLLALGLPYSLAHGSLRISLGRYNTSGEVNTVIQTVTRVITEMRA